MIAVVVSRADPVSVRIGEHLLDVAAWTVEDDQTRQDTDGGGRVFRTGGFELRKFDDRHLDIEYAARAFDDPELVVFASRHSGDTGPLLTGHFTGNFGPADYGGVDDGVAEACPNALSHLISAFDEHAPSGYEVGMECTHHGPSEVGAPSMFVELGSGPDQWEDPAAARAVARSILGIRGVTPHRERQLAGFGGRHYVPRFERIVRETEWAVGHIAADWGLDAMGPPGEHHDVVRQAFERSEASVAVIDGDRPELAAVIDDLGYRVMSETWIRETDGVPLSLVEACEEALCPIDGGLRFGELALDSLDATEFSVVSLPDELLAEASGIDAEQTFDVATGNLMAFETAESGTLVTGCAAVADETAYDRLVDALLDILAQKYDEVERTDDSVVARMSTFDPKKAAIRGVPEGPLYGRLASGESVTANDETIEPSTVQTERVERFPV